MKLWMKIGTITTGAIMTASSAVGFYFYLKPKEQTVITYKLGNKSSLNIINEAHISPKVLDIFSKLIEGQQFSGSEESMLSKIVFKSSSDNISEGTFISLNGISTISIDAKRIIRKHKFKGDYNLAYYLYQIYAHEYLHFVSNRYLNNGQQSISNPIFLKEFKKLLHYDKHALHKYSSKEIKPGFKSIGSIYDVKDLYDFSNNDISLPKRSHYHYVMSPKSPSFIFDKNHSIKDDSLKYLFGIDELFARKYMLINIKYKPTLSDNQNIIEGFRPDGFMNYKKNETSASPYLEDILNFRRSLNSDKGVFLQDDPFAVKYKLELLYSRIIGNTSNKIMNVKTLNKKEAISGNLFIKKTTIKENMKPSPYKFIGFKEKINHQTKTTFFPITIKRKTQIIKPKHFIVRDTFYTKLELPMKTHLKTLFVYTSKTDPKPVQLVSLGHFQ